MGREAASSRTFKVFATGWLRILVQCDGVHSPIFFRQMLFLIIWTVWELWRIVIATWQ
jgi:hypothetical protein